MYSLTMQVDPGIVCKSVPQNFVMMLLCLGEIKCIFSCVF